MLFWVSELPWLVSMAARGTHRKLCGTGLRIEVRCERQGCGPCAQTARNTTCQGLQARGSTTTPSSGMALRWHTRGHATPAGWRQCGAGHGAGMGGPGDSAVTAATTAQLEDRNTRVHRLYKCGGKAGTQAAADNAAPYSGHWSCAPGACLLPLTEADATSSGSLMFPRPTTAAHRTAAPMAGGLQAKLATKE
jgi:hypothetical protein